MSEEVKDIFECLRKCANLTPDVIDDLYYLEGYIEDLQQKVEQLEKEYEEADYDRHKLFDKIEQLENIRKETIEYLEYQLSQMNFEKDTKAKMLGAMTIVLLSEGSESDEHHI